MKKFFIAIVMTVFTLNGAHAATPRAEIEVEGSVVTVGDVFEGVTHDAGYVLAPAPAYGKTLTLGSYDLKRISDAFNLGWYPQDGFAQTVIRRSGHSIDRYAIEAALQKKIAAALSGRKFEMRLDDRSIAMHLPEGAGTALEVSNLRYDLARGDFTALVAARDSSLPAARREVSGRLYPLTSVPVLKAGLRQGDVISQDDLDYVDIRTAELGANIISAPSKLVGMASRRSLQPLKPLAASDIVLPVVVRKGDIVTMVLESATISLTAQGRALEHGAEGETVKVSNTSSGQTLEAVVTGPRTVRVRAPDNAGI